MSFNILTYLACICFIFLFGRIFIVPIKKILKLVFNSILGGISIYIINLIGSMYNFHIGLNIFTSIIVGLLGIPGAVLIVIIKLLIQWFWGRDFGVGGKNQQEKEKKMILGSEWFFTPTPKSFSIPQLLILQDF